MISSRNSNQLQTLMLLQTNCFPKRCKETTHWNPTDRHNNYAALQHSEHNMLRTKQARSEKTAPGPVLYC